MKELTSHAEWLITIVTLIGGFYILDSKIGATNERMDNFIFAWHAESQAWRAEWHAECKDFHGRLCAIEEKNKH